jgi:predicted ribosomally synthesized peptide with SipW-like signal peptide
MSEDHKHFAAVIILLLLIATSTLAAFAQSSKPPTAALKNFTSVSQWQLEVTWRAKDSLDDSDYTANLEMTGTARFILKRQARANAGASWHAESAQSGNLAYTGSLIYKPGGWRINDVATGGPIRMAAADLVVGAPTPGYQVGVTIAFPIKQTDNQGTHDTFLALVVGDPTASGAAALCTGPLPASGNTIHGSLVVDHPVPPFVGTSPRLTKVEITYVLQPIEPLVPLVPPKHK